MKKILLFFILNTKLSENPLNLKYNVKIYFIFSKLNIILVVFKISTRHSG